MLVHVSHSGFLVPSGCRATCKKKYACFSFLRFVKEPGSGTKATQEIQILEAMVGSESLKIQFQNRQEILFLMFSGYISYILFIFVTKV